MKPGLVNIGIGLLLVAIGLAVTLATYAAASNGGHYVVAWGAVAVGAWRFIVGCFQLLHGAVARQ
jgi:hypothetical protein